MDEEKDLDFEAYKDKNDEQDYAKSEGKEERILNK